MLLQHLRERCWMKPGGHKWNYPREEECCAVKQRVVAVLWPIPLLFCLLHPWSCWALSERGDAFTSPFPL